MQQNLQNKDGLVKNVFNKVYDKYDLMNDFMSLGVHRFWKKSLINMMNPSLNKNFIDVACGTGDIGKLYLDSTNKDNKITNLVIAFIFCSKVISVCGQICVISFLSNNTKGFFNQNKLDDVICIYIYMFHYFNY